jgi:putative transposase
MAGRLKYQLKDEELEILEQAIHQDKRPEVRQRATAIRMLHLGNHPSEVAEVMAVSLATVYNWHSRFRGEGLEGLANRPRSGRPSVADDEEYCRVLEETLDKEPPELGYAFNIWTINRLREHLEQQTGKRLSYERFRLLLKEKDYRYRRPKHDLHHLQDQEAKEQARQLLEELKKGSGETKLNSSLWTKQP